MEQVFAADKKQDELILPGFRFHPTDEELVGFYLRRKVGRKPLSIELIREVDIYKYNPWDLPMMSSAGEKEWYFFCIRVRKYRNSVRPNRVTDSGFWKATGIDKPIYSSGQTHHECIGLKKTLVFYRGAAGKGTKTEWMMHEFRLPPSCKNANQSNPKNTFHEAEVWTLCRVFKKIHSYKRYKSDWKNNSTTDRSADTVTSMSCSLESESSNQYANSEDFAHQHKMNVASTMHMTPKNHHFLAGKQISAAHESSYSSSNATLWDLRGDEFFKDRNWDELRSIVELASDPSNIYHGS